tara:strand:- start:258 stop:449 length:192 start_codon:yes stop_codon:yes gene_type:complete
MKGVEIIDLEIVKENEKGKTFQFMNRQETNWKKVLHGKKELKGILSMEEAKNIRAEFRKNQVK